MEPLTKCRFKVVIAGASGSTSSELSAISIGNLESSMGIAKMKHGSRTLTSRSGTAPASLGRLRIEFLVGAPGWKDIITWWSEVNDFAKKLEKRNLDIIVYDGEEEALQKIHLQGAWPCRYGFQGASKDSQTASLIQYLEFIAESFQITATDKVAATPNQGISSEQGATPAPAKPSVTIKFGDTHVKDAFKVSANMRDAFKAEGTLAVGGGIAGAALAASGHVVGSLLKGNGQNSKLADRLPERPTDIASADPTDRKPTTPDSTDNKTPTEAANQSDGESAGEPVSDTPPGNEGDSSESIAEGFDPSGASAEASHEAPAAPLVPDGQTESPSAEAGDPGAGGGNISTLGMAAASAAVIGAGALHASASNTNPPATQSLESSHGLSPKIDGSGSTTTDDFPGNITEETTDRSSTGIGLGSAAQLAAAGAGIASAAGLAATLGSNGGGSQKNQSQEPKCGLPAGTNSNSDPMPATTGSAKAVHSENDERLHTLSGPVAGPTHPPANIAPGIAAGTPTDTPVDIPVGRGQQVHPTQPNEQMPMRRGPAAGFNPRSKARYTRPISLSLLKAAGSSQAVIVVAEEGGESEDTLSVIRDLIEKDLSAKVIKSSWLTPVDAQYRWCGKPIGVTETREGLHIIIPDEPLRTALFDCLRSRLVVGAESAIK